MNDISSTAVDGLMAFLELKKKWQSFYEDLGLIDLAETLNSKDVFVDIVGLKEDENLKDLSIFFMPSVKVQKEFLGQIIKAVERPFNQISFANRIINRWEFQKVWLSPWGVEPNFSKIKFLNRPENRPYLFLTKIEKEASEETLNRSAIDLRQDFEKQGKVGMNLFEYLVFQYYIQKHLSKEKTFYPDECHSIWLLDSELDGLLNSRLPFLKIGKSLMVESIRGKQLKIWALPLDYNECNAQKARSGIVIPL